MRNVLNTVILMLLVFTLSFSAFAQNVFDADPALGLLQYALAFLHSTFPKAAPVIQLVFEILGSVAAFFTLLTVFVSGVLKLPLVVARFKGAHELEAKIKKLHDKIVPFLMKLSIFNAQKKK